MGKDFITISSDKETEAEAITVTTYSSDKDEDEFKPIEVKPLKELRQYKVVKHEQYGTTSNNVVDEEWKIKPWHECYTILGFVKTKYGEQKANVKLQLPCLVQYFKQWETLINGGLELLGFPHVTFVWGNMMYPKTKLTHPTRPKPKKVYN